MNSRTVAAVAGLVLVVGVHVATRQATIAFGADLGMSPMLAVALVAAAGLVACRRLGRA